MYVPTGGMGNHSGLILMESVLYSTRAGMCRNARVNVMPMCTEVHMPCLHRIHTWLSITSKFCHKTYT